jgi:RNA polymerase sigma-70 factor (ECF subfamily)
LYRIATNVCLNALASRKDAHRWLPEQRSSASEQMPNREPATDIPWLAPYPDVQMGIADEAPGPAVRYETRESVQLAFLALIQQLPPRQRAALLLCDVLGWSAAETASLLGGSSASINSVLQRARATLSERYPEGRARWYRGRESIRRFFSMAWTVYGGFRLVPTGANCQPAFAFYSARPGEAIFRAHSLQILEIRGDAIAAMTKYMKPLGPALFVDFGLPLIYEPKGKV